MTSPIAAMDTALYSTLNVGSVVGSGKTTGVHRYRAPNGVLLPIVIFGYMDDGDDLYTLGKGRAYVQLRYQIKVVYEGLSASTAAVMADTIDGLVTNVAISVTGFTLMLGRRIRPLAYQEDGEGGVAYQHVGGEYEFMLDPN